MLNYDSSDIQQAQEKVIERKHKPILCLDFDGVLHSYTSGWKGADVIPDPPVPGAIEFILDAMDEFEIHIFSSRSHQVGGIDAMRDWLRKCSVSMIDSGIFQDDPMLCFLDCIQWPIEKPPAMISIDDRGLLFTGKWPSIETLKNFKPWNKS